MALKSAKGPDRVLYGLSSLLQNKLPAAISTYNSSNKCETLLVIPGNNCTFATDISLSFSVTGNFQESITFPSGSYDRAAIIATINEAETHLSASAFGDTGILLTAPASIKYTSAFFNLKQGQIVNYIPLQVPNSFIISGTLPSEADIKAFPSVVVDMQGITPSDGGVMVSYTVGLTIGLTASLNTSQTDYLSKQLLKYYDVIRDILIEEDDGSLGGIANGVNIVSAGIDEATGNSYFLKFLTISLEIQVEED